MEYMSCPEAAKKWGISDRRVQKLCEENRIPGLSRIGNMWLIPKDAEKPIDQRTKTARRRLNSDKVLFSFARGRERCDRNGHAVFLRPRVDFATTGSEITGISTSSTKLK